MNDILHVLPGSRRKPDSNLDSTARSEARLLLEPRMREAISGSNAAACLLVRIACLIAQTVVMELNPINRMNLLIVLQEVVDWTSTTESCEAFLAVRSELEALLWLDPKEMVAGSSEVELTNMVRDIVSAATCLEPAWLELQPQGERRLRILGGATSACMFSYHGAAEIRIRLAGESRLLFHRVQRRITQHIICRVLIEGGYTPASERIHTSRFVSSARWREIMTSRGPTA